MNWNNRGGCTQRAIRLRLHRAHCNGTQCHICRAVTAHACARKRTKHGLFRGRCLSTCRISAQSSSRGLTHRPQRNTPGPYDAAKILAPMCKLLCLVQLCVCDFPDMRDVYQVAVRCDARSCALTRAILGVVYVHVWIRISEICRGHVFDNCMSETWCPS